MKYIAVLLLLFAVKSWSAYANLENMALRGRATQSDRSDFRGGASNAVDGNRNPNYFSSSCTQTTSQTDPWWSVDLLRTYVIHSIIITNRKDCCPERLNGAEIRVGDLFQDNGAANPVVAVIENIPAGQSQAFTFTNRIVEGRYVAVVLPGVNKVLSLCEVEVFGYQPPTGENLALRGTAVQSSVYEDAVAQNAIDGNRDSLYEHGSCMHTHYDLNPWWRVDLGSTYAITSVTVTNRMESYFRLHGAEILVGNSLENNGNNNPRCARIEGLAGGVTKRFDCWGMEGRYVNIWIPRSEFLHVCEVEVYGSPAGCH